MTAEKQEFKDNDAEANANGETPPPTEPPYTVLSEREKIIAILIASFSALTDDLNVSPTKINLSITDYMIFQGLALSLVGSYSDHNDRRPALFVCFLVYIAANVGLALQCIPRPDGVALPTKLWKQRNDQRGKYLAYSSMGVTAGQALGPVIGGLVIQYLQVQSAFWFLTAFAGFMMWVVIWFLPETSRNIVGNGSRPPQRWNRRVLDRLRQRWLKPAEKPAGSPTQSPPKHRPGTLGTFKISRENETAIILLFVGLLFCGYATVFSTLPSQLESKYGFNALQIGLCCLPYAFGSLTSRWTVGYLTDWNFRRHAHCLGITITKNRQTDLTEFPVESARLQITLPLVYLSSVFLFTYSWAMAYQTNLAGPLVMTCLAGHVMSGAINTHLTLLVDSILSSLLLLRLVICFGLFLGLGLLRRLRLLPVGLGLGGLGHY
ncbi:hypothetical protein BBP40_000663 [Aspergillus hancockii]|nr:hypothetical protein BBP40_000663 [Aspergillus hancockii]